MGQPHVTKHLFVTGGVASSLGLPASLTAFLGDDNAKPPDQNQVLSEIMQSPDVQKALQNQPR